MLLLGITNVSSLIFQSWYVFCSIHKFSKEPAEPMEDQDTKKVILTLRWTAIIVTSYLILFSRGRVTDPQLSHILIAVYLISNVLLTFLPKIWFSNPKLFYPLVIFDTGIVSLGMYFSEKMTTDFYFVFFLVIIFASISRNFKLLMALGGVTALLYGFLLLFLGTSNFRK